MLASLGALALGAYSLRGQIQTILEQLPEAASKVSAGFTRLRAVSLATSRRCKPPRAMEKAATQAADSPSTPKQPATHVVIDQPVFKLGRLLWVGSMGALGFMGQAVMVFFLVFFLLLAGDTFKRKLVRLTALCCRTRRSPYGSSTTSTAPSRNICSCC